MTLLPFLLASPKTDADEIRRAYLLKDRLFAQKDSKRLAATDLPTYHATDVDGSLISHEQIWKYMRWRFANQVACKRTEKPVRIEVKGKQARVEVRLTDDFTVRRAGGVLQHRIQTAHGWSTWQKTTQGWKQASLKFLSSEG